MSVVLSRADELVQSVSLHNPRKMLFNGYVLPFVLTEVLWIYCWIFVYGLADYYEPGLVGIAVIAVLQIFVCLCCQWSVHVHTFLNCSSSNDPYRANIAKVVPTPNNGSTELVKLHKSKSQEPWFIFQKTKYIWNPDKKEFRGLAFPINHSVKHYMNWKGYADEKEVQEAEETYGGNNLDMVVPEFWELFKERAIAPFFVFQVFCMALWCFDKYWYYSLFTLFMLVMFECTLVQQQLRNMAEIRKMGNKPYMIMVYRSRRWRLLFTDQLIPGDIVSITRSQNDNLVPCDMLLLRGPCIVDESMLTGESVPQMKEPIEDIDENTIVDIEGDNKLHVLYGGTKVVQHSPPIKNSYGLRATDNGCVAYVLRTGFSTCQGKLLRTILFGVKRVTANNLETFGFILFLLIFAIAAAAYVWVKGSEDATRNKYKLFLECTLILTSVVPPELPIELSLAVNTSLLALSKLGVFCTEPFRIPFAGKIEICCFDKTGTLTSDNLVVEGVAGIDGNPEVIQLPEAPLESVQVLATCHSLVQLDNTIVGDPLEKATLKAISWNLTKGEAVIPVKGKSPGLKIIQRHHFSSALKRMCVVAGYATSGSVDITYIVTVKGAPETLKSMFSSVPNTYEEIYLALSRRGARVLALGYRKLPSSTTLQDLRNYTRDELESELTFVGFVIISCPLKSDSKSVIKEIINASHSVVMITGDNPLTACHVARELHFTKKPVTLILINVKDSWHWASIDGIMRFDIDKDTKRNQIWEQYALCITGEGLSYLKDYERDYLYKILPHVGVFARCAPKQKEYIITTLQEIGYVTLMCGDGTNDVGALKHASVGVAILSSPPKRNGTKSNTTTPVTPKSSPTESMPPTVNGPRVNSRQQQMNSAKSKIEKLMKDLEEQERSVVVKLGDASIAAPFTSKFSSIQCICHVIKQGRCTLVTTLQMFKILALNALILAYSQSVLYLDGIKFSDAQATLQGILLAICFLFISRSKPLKTLSKQRPLPNIFNVYTVLTVLLQFAIHFCCLIYIVREAVIRSPKDERLSAILAPKVNTTNVPSDSDKEEENFQMNLINSTVYIMSMALQVSTFAVNYRGQPFMESLWENKLLLYSLASSTAAIFALALGIVPDIAQQFEIVDFPSDFRRILVQVLVANFVLTFLVDRACRWLFGEGKYRKL
ncbi:endoplasmic reticulum transmembrane helix translocase [Phymastichus coffea]|uniref:endoplasmic reticulum transmembrane helix translocase n=1 Tax=Phymastichus coffea TaxID=108790 RepID=UPI00273BB6E2|nr:endoplasmic reticulum transmembrane helix translocase [Phymastichus coffea]